MDVVVWLRSLGLGQYEALFRENDIDETVLPNLTAEDLRELGVASLGHRRKLLDAIAALRTDASGKAPTADVTTSSSAPSISPVTYWRFCEGLIDPVASSGVLDQLHARPIFSLISDTPDSTKFVSLFSPAAVPYLFSSPQHCITSADITLFADVSLPYSERPRNAYTHAQLSTYILCAVSRTALPRVIFSAVLTTRCPARFITAH